MARMATATQRAEALAVANVAGSASAVGVWRVVRAAARVVPPMALPRAAPS